MSMCSKSQWKIESKFVHENAHPNFSFDKMGILLDNISIKFEETPSNFSNENQLYPFSDLMPFFISIEEYFNIYSFF